MEIRQTMNVIENFFLTTNYVSLSKPTFAKHLVKKEAIREPVPHPIKMCICDDMEDNRTINIHDFQKLKTTTSKSLTAMTGKPKSVSKMVF